MHELLWSLLETRVRFPASTPLRQLEHVLQEEWNTTLLEAVQNLYKCTARRTEAILRATGGPTPY
jgi:hypothetical protein